MRSQQKKRCYMHVGSGFGIILGVFAGIMFKSVPLGICIVLGLMFGGAIGGLVDGKA